MYDLIVIGGGPGGYVSAIRAAQNGLKVACVEKRTTLGGTCLNEGCIPSKILLESTHRYDMVKHGLKEHGISVSKIKIDIDVMQASKYKKMLSLSDGINTLFKKHGIDLISGAASFISEKEILIDDKTGVSKSYFAENFVIATGSVHNNLPNVVCDEKNIISSTGALEMNNVPKKMIVVGGGYIGLELGSVWSRLGTDVHIIEFSDRIVPLMDSDISSSLMKILTKQGLKFNLSTKVNKINIVKNGVSVDTECLKSSAFTNDIADVVLIAVGRVPYTKNLNLSLAGIAVDDAGFIIIDKKFRTSNPNVYAVGDVTGKLMLAHKAEEEGIAVADIICNKIFHIDYEVIPSVIYTNPEVASVGNTEDMLKSNGINYKIGKFNFFANSRARTVDATDGFVKVISCSKTDRVLGCHIIGKDAGTMIHEVAALMSFSGSSEDLAMMCHAHPTLNEAIKEAMLSVSGQAIHC